MNTNIDKIPPQDIDAERSVIGSCFVSVEALDTAMELLEPDNFYTTTNRLVFIAIQNLYNLDIGIDIVTTAQELRRKEWIEQIGGEVYLSELLENISTSPKIKSHCEILVEKSKLRDLGKIANEAHQAIFNPDADSNKIISSMDYKLVEMVNNSKKHDTVHVKDVLPEVYKSMEEAKKGKKTGVTTGFKILDEKMGVYQNGDLYIIAGRPSMGKSSFMLNSAYNSSKITGKNVLIFSLEMSNAKLVTRLVSAASKIDSTRIKYGNISEKETLVLNGASGDVHSSGVWINDNPRLNIYQIRTICNRMKRKHDISAVFIDYLQMVAKTGEVDSKPQETALISNVGKVIAKDLNIPVIELSQLSRDIEKRPNKRPVLSDLRWSGDIEQDADVILFPYRDWVYNKKSDPKQAEIIIGKNRDGNIGTITNFKFEKEITSFVEVDPLEIDAMDFTIPQEEDNGPIQERIDWTKRYD